MAIEKLEIYRDYGIRVKDHTDTDIGIDNYGYRFLDSDLSILNNENPPSLWLDSSDSSTLFDSVIGGSSVAPDSNVARWEDKSGNNRHLTQSSDSSRFQKKSSIQNGLDSVLLSFNDYMDHIGSSPIPNNSKTVIAVLKSSNETGGSIINNLTSNPATNRYVARMLKIGGTRYIAGDTTTNSVTTTYNYDTEFQSPCVVVWTENNDRQSSFYINGISRSTTGTILEEQPTSGFRVGSIMSAGGSALHHFNGYLYELICIDDEVDTDTRQLYEGLLSNKWGISSLLEEGHPYKYEGDNTLISGLVPGGNPDSLYSFNYKKPDIYPSSIIVAYNGIYNGSFELNDFASTQIGFNDVSISGYSNTRRFSFSNEDLTSVFNRAYYRGNIGLDETDKINKLGVFFDGTKNTNNRESSNGNLSILKPRTVENSSSVFNIFYPPVSGGTTLLNAVNQPSSGIDTDLTFIKSDGSQFYDLSVNAGNPPTHLAITFEDSEYSPLSTIDKLVLRVRSKNPNYTESNNQRSLFNCSIYPKIFNESYVNLSILNSNKIATQTATQVVGSGSFSNYDIDFDFRDPFSLDEDGFNYIKKYNSTALINDSVFTLYGFSSGIEISSIELLKYTKSDRHIPFSLPCRVYFEDNIESNLDGFTQGGKSFNNSMYVENIYNDLFNKGLYNGFYDFRESTGNRAYPLDTSDPLNYLKYYAGVSGSYSNFNWSSFYRNLNTRSFVYRDSVYVDGHDDSFIEFNKQPDLTENFTLYLSISSDTLDTQPVFGSGIGQVQSLIYNHGNAVKNEFEIYHRSDLQRFYLTVNRTDGGTNSIYVDSNEKDNIDLIVMCQKSGSNSSILFYEDSSSEVVFMSVNNRYTSATSKSYIFGAPTGRSTFKGSYGFINNVGIASSGFSSEDYTNFFDSRRKQGKLLNGDNFIKLQYSGIETNLNINTGFTDNELFVNNEGLYQQDLFDYAYNSLKNNPSGLVIEYEFDNFTNRDIFIDGSYSLGSDSSFAFHHYSGIIPSGLNQNIKLTPHTSYFEDINKDNFSFAGLNTRINTYGSGTYNLDLKWKKVALNFDGWVIPFTGLENVNLYTNGEQRVNNNLDLYLASNYQLDDIDLYVRGKDLIDDDLDLYLEAGRKFSSLDLHLTSKELLSSSIDFYTLSETKRENIDLVTYGKEVIDESIDLYLNSATKIVSGFDMTLLSGLRKSSSFPMYTSGLTPDSLNNNIPLSTFSSDNPSQFKTVDMYVNSELDPQNVFNMFIKSAGSDSQIFNMYLEQSNNREKSIDMFLFNKQVFVDNSLPFYMNVPYSGLDSNFPMYLERAEGTLNSIPFVMSSKEVSSSDFDLFLNSASLVSGDSVNMYIRGSGLDGKTINLFTHGF